MKSSLASRACAAALAVIFCAVLAACLPDRLGWSGDGKTLHYVCPDGSALKAWDAESRSTKTLFSEPGEKVSFCYDAVGSGALFFATDRPGSKPDEPIRDLHLIAPGGAVIQDLAKDVSVEAGMSASADGRRAFFFRDDKPSKKWELWSVDPTEEKPAPRRVFAQSTLFGYPCASADGKRVLLTFETSIGVLDVDAGTTKTLIQATKILPALYGVWALDETAIVYMESHAKKDDPSSASSLGDLMLLVPADGSKRRLGAGVPIFRRPMLGKGGATAYATQAITATPGEPKEFEEFPLKEIQVASFDLKTGERRILTSEPEGAFWPAPDPTGARLAYSTARKGTRGDKPDELLLKVATATGDSAESVDCSK